MVGRRSQAGRSNERSNLGGFPDLAVSGPEETNVASGKLFFINDEDPYEIGDVVWDGDDSPNQVVDHEQ